MKVNLAALMLRNGNTNREMYKKKVYLVFGMLFDPQDLLNTLKSKLGGKS